MQLETQLNKKEIFELYMNKLNFGDRIRGVEKPQSTILERVLLK